MNLRTASCILNVTFVMLVCTMPAVLGSDTRFASGKSALAIPFEAENDIIYLRIVVNDCPPLTFNLDTGASYSILNLRHAKSFGLELQPLGKVEGGSGPEPPDVYLATDSVSIGLRGVLLASQSVRATVLDKVQGCLDKAADGRSPRRVLDGIPGADFFNSLVVGIAYRAISSCELTS